MNFYAKNKIKLILTFLVMIMNILVLVFIYKSDITNTLMNTIFTFISFNLITSYLFSTFKSN